MALISKRDWVEPGLAGRPFEAPKGDKEYWRQRNALVDACRAANARLFPHGIDGGLSTDPAVRQEANDAADALDAFDAQHGGTPIL